MMLASLVDVLSRPDLLQYIVDSFALSPVTLHNLTLLSRSVRPSAHLAQRHMYHTGRFLSPIFGQVPRFQQLMNTGDIIVTGMPVFWYLAEFLHSLDGLVLAVHPRLADQLIVFLLSEGFELRYNSVNECSPESRDTDPAGVAAQQKIAFEKQDTDGLLWVYIPKISPLHVLLMQRSTFLMNGIHGSVFFSLYAKASIFKRAGFIAKPSTRGARSHQRLLHYFGYRAVVEVRYGREHVSLLCGPRHVGDRWTWSSAPLVSSGARHTILGQGWSVCELVVYEPSAADLRTTHSSITASLLTSPLLGRTLLASTLAGYFISKLLKDVECTARTGSILSVPIRWDNRVFDILEHFYSRTRYLGVNDEGVVMAAATFDYSHRVGY